jgi:diaminopimelate epimerase
MRVKFTKMHGLGNDFVVLDAVSQAISLTPEQARFLADRHFGVGCDQVLVVERAARPDADFRYRIFNADGGEVEQCGNGARLLRASCTTKGLTAKRAIRVETKGGLIEPRLEDDGLVTGWIWACRASSRRARALRHRRRRWCSRCSWTRRNQDHRPQWATRMRCSWWPTLMSHRSRSRAH